MRYPFRYIGQLLFDRNAGKASNLWPTRQRTGAEHFFLSRSTRIPLGDLITAGEWGITMRKVALLACAAPIVLSGCYTTSQVAQPTEITLDTALSQVADSLDRLQTKTESRDKFGLIPDQVTVAFNVTAKATGTNSATLNLAAVPAIGGTLGLSGTSSNVDESARGNTITIVFKNLATADLSKGMYAKGSKIDPTCLSKSRAKDPKCIDFRKRVGIDKIINNDPDLDQYFKPVTPKK